MGEVRSALETPQATNPKYKLDAVIDDLADMLQTKQADLKKEVGNETKNKTSIATLRLALTHVRKARKALDTY